MSCTDYPRIEKIRTVISSNTCLSDRLRNTCTMWNRKLFMLLLWLLTMDGAYSMVWFIFAKLSEHSIEMAPNRLYNVLLSDCTTVHTFVFVIRELLRCKINALKENISTGIIIFAKFKVSSCLKGPNLNCENLTLDCLTVIWDQGPMDVPAEIYVITILIVFVWILRIWQYHNPV